MVTLYSLNFDMPKFPRPSTTPAYLQLQAEGTMQCGGSIFWTILCTASLDWQSELEAIYTVCVLRETRSRPARRLRKSQST